MITRIFLAVTLALHPAQGAASPSPSANVCRAEPVSLLGLGEGHFDLTRQAWGEARWYRGTLTLSGATQPPETFDCGEADYGDGCVSSRDGLGGVYTSAQRFGQFLVVSESTRVAGGSYQDGPFRTMSRLYVLPRCWVEFLPR